MISIRRETPEDIDAIRYVNERAFGQRQEADIVDVLRDHNKVILSIVAELDGSVVGHILFSSVIIESASSSFPAVALGPMAVLPEFQRKGIGSRLVHSGLEECRMMDHEIVVVLGHPDYYPRFGFVPARAAGIECEFEVADETWMLLEFREGALGGRRGTAKYQPEFQD
jgi:putative acetyltransferase